MGFEERNDKTGPSSGCVDTRAEPWGRDRCGVFLHVREAVEARADAAGSRGRRRDGGPGWTFPDRPHPGAPSQGKAAQLTAARSPLLLWSNSGQSLRAERRRQGY